jgi:hypothetical protein
MSPRQGTSLVVALPGSTGRPGGRRRDGLSDLAAARPGAVCALGADGEGVPTRDDRGGPTGTGRSGRRRRTPPLAVVVTSGQRVLAPSEQGSGHREQARKPRRFGYPTAMSATGFPLPDTRCPAREALASGSRSVAVGAGRLGRLVQAVSAGRGPGEAREADPRACSPREQQKGPAVVAASGTSGVRRRSRQGALSRRVRSVTALPGRPAHWTVTPCPTRSGSRASDRSDMPRVHRAQMRHSVRCLDPAWVHVRVSPRITSPAWSVVKACRNPRRRRLPSTCPRGRR